MPGVRGLSQEDISDLESIATIKHHTGTSKGKPSQGAETCLTVTVPQEFKFATSSRLKNKNPEESVTCNKKGPLKAVHNGPTIPQEFHFATDSRVKKQTVSEGEDDPAAFPNTLRCGSSTQVC